LFIYTYSSNYIHTHMHSVTYETKSYRIVNKNEISNRIDRLLVRGVLMAKVLIVYTLKPTEYINRTS